MTDRSPGPGRDGRSAVTNDRLVLHIIACHGWRNGRLLELVEKALRGAEITRADTDLSEAEWNRLIEGVEP